MSHEGQFMSRHARTKRPSDKDLDDNPLIGGAKGARMAGAHAEDIEDIEGENTIVGDVENDTNPQGGIDKPSRPRPERRGER
jgi:hypothetical protein